MISTRFLRWKLPAILYALFILFLTSYPKLETPDLGIDWADKVYHFGAYFLFGFLLARAFSENSREKAAAVIYRSILFGILFAIFDEIHQIYIPGRYGDVTDAVADILGIVLGHAGFWLFISRRFLTSGKE